jgi:NAD(P)H-quinone oxidoreductase subunit 4L
MQDTMGKNVGIAYAVMALSIAGLYVVYQLLGANQQFIDIPVKVSRHLDYLCFAVLSLLGALAIYMKGSPIVVMSSGSFASLVTLTLTQEPLIRFLTLGAVLFAIGMYGMVASRNAVRVLMSIELMLSAVTINLVAFARYVDPAEVKGQVFAIFILTVAAAEAAVGLAIVLAIYRNTSTVDMERFDLLKW